MNTQPIAPDSVDRPTVRYLSRAQVARRIGVGPRSLSRIKLPKEDAVTGPYKGWMPETIDRWKENRPGRGNWGARGVLR